MKKVKRIFGGIDLTWKKLILFSIISGVYTALMALIPIVNNTSFHDIAVTFEVWILFGIIIIMNSKSAKDSMIKCFVFFLISQPLVYLIQVPFNDFKFDIFNNYMYWFKWTILTIPMGYIGYYVKKNKWWSFFILMPILLLLGCEYYGYLRDVLFDFPHHLLTTLFCFITLLLYPLCLFDNKKIKISSLVFSILIVIVSTVLVLSNKKIYNVTLLSFDDDLTYNENYKVYLKDDIGDVYIKKYDDTYVVEGDFVKTGKTNLILDDNDNKIIFEIEIFNDTYNIKKV